MGAYCGELAKDFESGTVSLDRAIYVRAGGGDAFSALVFGNELEAHVEWAR